jgi:hypothetical protein
MEWRGLPYLDNCNDLLIGLFPSATVIYKIFNIAASDPVKIPAQIKTLQSLLIHTRPYSSWSYLLISLWPDLISHSLLSHSRSALSFFFSYDPSMFPIRDSTLPILSSVCWWLTSLRSLLSLLWSSYYTLQQSCHPSFLRPSPVYSSLVFITISHAWT